MALDDGLKTPEWSEREVLIPLRLLQECALALSPVRGLVQRLESHGEAFGNLDARDERALEWGREAYVNVQRELGKHGLRV